MKILTVITTLLYSCVLIAQHPVTYFTKAEVTTIRKNIAGYPLLHGSFKEIKQSVDAYIGKDIDVPYPKDAAGGYSHDQHKANYTLMFNSGILYQLTGEHQYAALVKQLFFKYTSLNPTLGNHPQATTNSPGHLFWQALNDVNWLVYTGIAFDCIHDYLTATEREKIAEGAFKPEIDFVTKDLNKWFNVIHNQALWACAGVGIVGIATDNNNYVQTALLGTSLHGDFGFWANLNQLFSPDGYYVEGPYYARYALLPVYLFANALQHKGYKAFQHRDSILKKALDCTLQQTNLNGSFFAYNDALKEKTFLTNEIVEAIDIYRLAYGKNIFLLPIVKQQSRVSLNNGGMLIAEDMATIKNITAYYTYKTVDYVDGPEGSKGGVSILRSGKADSLTSLIFKYASQGMGHGHFDRLNINLYDNGHEVLQDYGAVRFINIEQKWGGRYLPETKSFAQQSIAHNTIVVDEKSHFNANEIESEKFAPQKLFSVIHNANIKVVSAAENRAYTGVQLRRTLYMITLKDVAKPIIVDVFKANSDKPHQYDLPFYYLGDFIQTNIKYKAFTNNQTTVSNKNGYQYLWKEAEAVATPTLSQITFLQKNVYYSISSVTGDSSTIVFARIGANDSNYNLRREPAYIIRKKGQDQTFINVIESHGNFNPTTEISFNAYPSVQKIEVLRNDSAYTVFEIRLKKSLIRIAQSNSHIEQNATHQLNVKGSTLQWVGPYKIEIQKIID